MTLEPLEITHHPSHWRLRERFPDAALVGGNGDYSVYEAEEADDFYLVVDRETAALPVADSAALETAVVVSRFSDGAARRAYLLAHGLPLFDSKAAALEHIFARLDARRQLTF